VSSGSGASGDAPGSHLVLVGLPGAGKTTTGRLLAPLLGRPFVDLDELIVAQVGLPIPRIFAERGEEYFRAVEHELTESLPARAASVVSPGGGWIENSDNLRSVRPPARIVYLLVSPGVALSRMRDSAAERPLLAGPDPEGSLRALLERRRTLYAQADFQVDTELLTPQQVANTVARLALDRGIRVG
jgi:shikimate kinase